MSGGTGVTVELGYFLVICVSLVGSLGGMGAADMCWLPLV